MKDEKLDPNLFNIDILLLNKDNLFGIGEVTKLNVFEPNSTVFDGSGLYSTEIFGPVGSETRSLTYGYINLRMGILHPLVFQHLTGLKSYYENIMAGKAKAIFDKNTNDFILSDEDGSDTGYSFFIKHLPKIKFLDNESDQRKYRIALVNRYKHPEKLLDKWLVLPAGLRDYTIDNKGNPAEDEVNDLYRKLLATVSMVRNAKLQDEDVKLLDPIRVKIQRITLEIYEHYKTLLEGKNKFILGKWAKRAIMHGTRNVITPSMAHIDNLDEGTRITHNHTVIGLYQYIKAISPITFNKLHAIFISRIMHPSSGTVVLFNKETLRTEMIDVPIKRRDEWLSLEGLADITSKLSQDDAKRSPVIIHDHYMFLVYDTGKEVEVIFNSNDIRDDMDKKYLRPITYIELLYIAIYDVREKYPGFLTRYPVAGLGGIYPTYLYVKTTVKGRTVKLKIDGVVKEMVEYPKLTEEFVKSLSPHYSHLAKLDADFDGDTASLNVLYEETSIKEIKNMLNSKEYYLTPDGSLTYSSSTDTLKLVLGHMTA